MDKLDKVLLNTDNEIVDNISMKMLNRVSNVPLPARFSRGKRFTNKPKYIVIHDSNCLNHSDSVLNIDSPRTGMGALKINNITKGHHKDINFHYIVDRLGNDYEIISGRPINIHCEHDDVSSQFDSAIHVIILCDLNVEVPKTRMYQILAYRCLAPTIRMLKIGGDPKSVIRFHSDIMKENKDDILCPGSFLAKELLIAQTRRYL